MNKHAIGVEEQAHTGAAGLSAARPPLRQRLHAASAYDNLDRLALILAFIGGSGGIILLKTSPMGLVVPALFAAGVLFAYAGLLWLSGRVSLEPEAIGDNCYYLGFLFTLTSLSVTLYQLSEATGQMDLQRDIIAGFGVALSSTVVGVFLRVLLLQYRPDIVVRDRIARVELVQAGREFRTALSQSLIGMKSFSTEAVQLAGETTGKINASLEQVAEHQRQQMAHAAQAWRDELSVGISSAVGGLSDEMRTMVSSSLAPLRDEIGRVLNGIETAAKRQAEAMAQDAEAQVERLRATGEQIAAAAEALRTLTAEIGALSTKIGSANKSMARGFDTAGKKLEASTEAVAVRLATSLDEIDEAIARLKPTLALEGLSEALKAPIERLDETTRLLLDLQERLTTTAEIPSAVDREEDASTPSVDDAEAGHGDIAPAPKPAEPPAAAVSVNVEIAGPVVEPPTLGSEPTRVLPEVTPSREPPEPFSGPWGLAAHVQGSAPTDKPDGPNADLRNTSAIARFFDRNRF